MNVLAMSDLAICIENCILSAGEGLSKRYPARALRAGRIGFSHELHELEVKNNSSNSWPKTNSPNSWQETENII